MARNEGSDKTGRIAQIRGAYQVTRRVDPKILPILLLSGLGVLAVCLVIGFVTGHPVYLAVLGVALGLLVVTIVFGRRAERAAYLQVEGQPGAAAAVLNALRRGWTVTPAVAVTRNQDIVHRAVGRPGIVLIGEGAPHRVANLLGAEKRRMSRIAGEAPVYDVMAGNAEGQVPLRKLQRHLMKLPRHLRPAEVTELNNRLRAVGTGSNVPIPKGPLPKNARLPRGGKLR
ncbi:MAG: DUF4191 domain-containing protein [Carbonactinosporaceae bacterium]